MRSWPEAKRPGRKLFTKINNATTSREKSQLIRSEHNMTGIE